MVVSLEVNIPIDYSAYFSSEMEDVDVVVLLQKLSKVEIFFNL